MSMELWMVMLCASLILGAVLSSQAADEPAGREEIEKRAAEILGRMTLDEKIDYVGGVDRFYIRSVPRLDLPRLRMADGPLGVRNYGPSTSMAAGIALAASWDLKLAERVGVEIGRDARARGVHFLLGPGVNIYRAPMNGRNFEYYGEDPFLAASIAAHFIGGVQSQGVSATVKHFIANNSEFDRRESDAVIDERTLREIYLPTFEAAVKEADVGAVMTSYNRTNGEYMSQNARLVQDVLKKEFGFSGIVMSDWTSTYDGVKAAMGGLDLEMPSAEAMNADVLRRAVKSGKIPEEILNDKVRRILRTAVRFGWLDRDQSDETIPLYSRDGMAAALDAARGSMVLLKNESGLLPLDKAAIKRIAVIGPNAHPAVSSGGGSARVVPFHGVSFLEGLSDTLKETADVYYHKGIAFPGEIADESRFFVTPDGGQPGMGVEVFDSTDLGGRPARKCVEKQVGAGECLGDVPPPFSSVRWTGYFAPSLPGEHALMVQIPGERIGYRLYLDGSVVLDAWDYSRALLDVKRVSVADGMHKVVLEVVRRGGGFAGGKLRLGIARTDGIVDPAALSLARQSDAVVVAVGFDHEIESESGDRSYRLPPGQDELIAKIVEANPNTIAVITSGGSVDLSAWIEKVPAVIAAWYPGQEGGVALSEILFGLTNPSGRLPISMEKNIEDNPSVKYYYPAAETDEVRYGEGVFVGYRGFEKNGVEPLFPFGFGLSYTEFRYSDLEIKPSLEWGGDNAFPEGQFEVSFDLENTGRCAGADVAQIYITSAGREIPRPLKEMKGFVKVELEAGEKSRVTVKLNRRDFCYYDSLKGEWQIEAGDREILVGRSSAEIVLRGRVTLTAAETAVP